MAKLEPLNAQDHRRLRIGMPDRGDRIFVQIVASEFATAAMACPILFAKMPETGQFYAGAMFGFRPEEPALIVQEGFQPLDVELQGFFTSDEHILLDVEHVRFSETAGEPLFDEDGQPGDRLRGIQRALGQLTLGIEQTDAFIRELLGLRLIEPIDISLRFDDGDTLRLEGLYTVSRDALRDLEDEDALRLFRSGYLQFAHAMTASLNQIPLMARRRNQRLSQGL